MKKLSLLFAITIVLMLTGCVKPEDQKQFPTPSIEPTPSIQPTPSTESMAIDAENDYQWIATSNAGNFAIQGDRVFYCYNGSLYSRNIDGSNKQILNDNLILQFHVSGNQIFFVMYNQDYSLHAMNTDGSNMRKLSDDRVSSSSWKVFNDWIYYKNENDRSVYRIKTDGSERTILSADDVLYMGVDEDRICYSNSNGTGIYSMKTDGSDKVKLSNDNLFLMTVLDGWIYFNNENDNSMLYAMKIDGSDRHKVTDDYAPHLFAVDERIYYLSGYEWKLYTINTDGSDRRLLSDDSVRWFIVHDNLIYYTMSGSKIYTMNTDGGDKQLLMNLSDDRPCYDMVYEIRAALHDDMPEYHFKATGVSYGTEDWSTGYVMSLDVFDENGVSILTVDYSEIDLDEVIGSPVLSEMMDTMGLHISDVNFDGYRDVIILNDFGGAHANTWYDCWLWDTETSSFIASESFSEICNPAIDWDKQCIYSVGGSGADYWGGKIYKYIDDEFVLTNELEGYWRGLTEKAWVNGQMEIVRQVSYQEDKEVEEEHREREYYNNNEMWQLEHPRWYWYGGHHADPWLDQQ